MNHLLDLRTWRLLQYFFQIFVATIGLVAFVGAASAQSVSSNLLNWVGKMPGDKINGINLADAMNVAIYTIVPYQHDQQLITVNPIRRGPDVKGANGTSIPTLYFTYCEVDVTCGADKLGKYGKTGTFGQFPAWAATYIILSNPKPLVYTYVPYVQGGKLSDYNPDDLSHFSVNLMIDRFFGNGDRIFTGHGMYTPSVDGSEGPWKTYSSSTILDPQRGSRYILDQYGWALRTIQARVNREGAAVTAQIMARQRERDDFIAWCRSRGGLYQSEGDSCATR